MPRIIEKLSYLFATVLRIGHLPWAPGTWGSLAALLTWYSIVDTISIIILIVITLILLILGVYTSSITERIVSANDPSVVVIDEWVGQWIALLLLPKSILWGVAAFILFRLFDIWKPFPIKKMDQLHGGIGIMLDDVIAGAYALIILNGTRYFII